MRYAGVKELKHRTMDLIKESAENDIIITAYGKPAAVLHHITEEDLADYLIENDPKFRSRVESAYAEYLKVGAVAAGDLLDKLERRRARKTV
jgi:hypothetical protein